MIVVRCGCCWREFQFPSSVASDLLDVSIHGIAIAFSFNTEYANLVHRLRCCCFSASGLCSCTYTFRPAIEKASRKLSTQAIRISVARSAFRRSAAVAAITRPTDITCKRISHQKVVVVVFHRVSSSVLLRSFRQLVIREESPESTARVFVDCVDRARKHANTHRTNTYKHTHTHTPKSKSFQLEYRAESRRLSLSLSAMCIWRSMRITHNVCR